MESFEYITTHSKVNIGLLVYSPRADGYHPLCSIFQAISLSDQIAVSKLSKKSFSLACSNRDIPTDHRNILTKIFEHYKNRIPFGLKLFLDKTIPTGGGLGGGSGNAAGFLAWLNHTCKWNMDLPQLIKEGVRFGADVPFFLVGGTALIRGIGEKITCLPFVKDQHFVLINPKIHVSTPTVFKAYDRAYQHTLRTPGPTPKRILKLKGENQLQDIVFSQYPDIAYLAAEITRLSGHTVQMSGSGATLFISVEQAETAIALRNKLHYHFPKLTIEYAQPVKTGYTFTQQHA